MWLVKMASQVSPTQVPCIRYNLIFSLLRPLSIRIVYSMIHYWNKDIPGYHLSNTKIKSHIWKILKICSQHEIAPGKTLEIVDIFFKNISKNKNCRTKIKHVLKQIKAENSLNQEKVISPSKFAPNTKVPSHEIHRNFHKHL